MKKFTKPSAKIPVLRDSLGVNTLPELIESSSDKFGDNIAYRTPRGNAVYEITYGRVLDMVKKLARYLKELGVEKGDHVAILGENRPEWGISLFAVSWIGAVAIPLDARAPLENQKFILSFSLAKAVIVSSSFHAGIRAAADGLKDLRHIILMDNIDDICCKYATGAGGEEVLRDSLLEILFTSGTTGDPKGVMLSHRNIISNVDDMHRTIDYNPGDRAFSILPVHHSYECTCGLIATFCSGMSVFYGRGLKSRDLIQDLKLAKPTVWLSTPLILEKLYLRIHKEVSGQTGLRGIATKLIPKRIIRKKIKRSLGLDDIRLIISGGAALPVWISEGLYNYGLEVIQGYGLSEASPLIAVNPPSKPKPESIGMIIPSNDVEIRDADSEGNGEIAARGPNIMLGYYKNRSATEETLTSDGWLLTGDIGYFDEDGYLYITGRKKNVIVTRGGENIFPEEIEEKLAKSPFIEEALVFSPDDLSVQALIYPQMEEAGKKLGQSGEPISPENLWELMRGEVRKTNRELEPYKRIRHFALRLEEFPKTTTRKIKRYLFKDLNLTHGIKIM
ncbi:MAG: AMP-dependent synthetase/ligase [Thermodesulfobacteriota bacterium]